MIKIKETKIYEITLTEEYVEMLVALLETSTKDDAIQYKFYEELRQLNLTSK